MTCTVFHVRPSGGIWKVEEVGGRARGSHASKAEAVKAARNFADEYRPSKVVVHGGDGGVERERCYQELPAKPHDKAA